MNKNNDPTTSIIDRIMNNPVPNKGLLTHPLESKPKKKSIQLTFDDIVGTDQDDGFPEDIKHWSPKTFIKFFCLQYGKSLNLNYRPTYGSDTSTFANIMNFFASSGLNKFEYTKKFIEWGFRNKEDIIKRKGYITPQTLRTQINFFFQDQVIPGLIKGDIVREQNDTSLKDEIDEAMKSGQTFEIFENFGIPIGMSYFHYIKGFDYAKLVKAMQLRFDELLNDGVDGIDQLERVFRRSMILSPYPDTFLGLDWRVKYIKYTKQFKNEQWWCENDYPIAVQNKYHALCKKN